MIRQCFSISRFRLCLFAVVLFSLVACDGDDDRLEFASVVSTPGRVSSNKGAIEVTLDKRCSSCLDYVEITLDGHSSRYLHGGGQTSRYDNLEAGEYNMIVRGYKYTNHYSNYSNTFSYSYGSNVYVAPYTYYSTYYPGVDRGVNSSVISRVFNVTVGYTIRVSIRF